MHTNAISLARKFLGGALAALALALLAGCDSVVVTNLTPPSLPENPSQIYTFTLRVTRRSNTIAQSSLTPRIVIDGKNYDMKAGAIGDGIYEFDYQLPAGRADVAYYFLVGYSVEGNNTVDQREVYTEVTRSQIVRRYVLSLEVNRAPVGARVSVLGRGFTPQDVVFVEGTPARTVFESPNALSFFVPALAPNRNYRVALGNTAGSSPVGALRVDPSSLTVSPSALNLRGGEHGTLTFTIPNAAPPGGTLLDITTDVPESVIMPEVIVPTGQTSVTITVEGGKPGTGSLFLKGFGNGEVNVPVSVR